MVRGISTHLLKVTNGLALLVLTAVFQTAVAQSLAPANFPPTLPVTKAPIERFRELLALSPNDREKVLDEKSPEQRQLLRAKLEEYAAMTAEERELRLAVTELRWYLVPLLRLAPTNRVLWLDQLPSEKRPLIDDRLRRWDTLTSAQQHEFLENEMTVSYFLRLEQDAASESPGGRPAAVTALESDLARWRALPENERGRMREQFQQFFELSPVEKEKTLGALSASERSRMEQTLQSFAQLPPAQRRHCLRSFSKFANMSAQERSQFLRKAEMWKKMKPSDREAWRNLVDQFPQMPPLPPGLKIDGAMPPFPSSPKPARSK